MGYPDGTSGHSGSDTSQARAEHERDSGTKPLREETVLRYLDAAQRVGVTYSELCGLYGWHHGQASSVLSTLHQEGRIARLAIRRNRCKVYVLPEWAGDLATEPHGGRKAERDLALIRLEMILAVIGDGYENSPGTLGQIYRIASGTAGV